jgi:hypothetical protein
MSDQSAVRPVATRFAALLYRYRTRGFIDLVKPATFEEQCAEQRLLRDSEDPPLASEPAPVSTTRLLQLDVRSKRAFWSKKKAANR